MNRKLVNGLLLLTLSAGACSTFTSCKDTDEDFKNEVIADQAALRAELLKLIDQYKCMCPSDADALLAQVRTFLTSDNTELKGDMGAIIMGYVKGKYVEQGAYDEFKNQVTTNLGSLDTRLTNMGSEIAEISNLLNQQGDEVEGLQNELQELVQWLLDAGVNNINDAIAGMEEFMNRIEPQVAALQNRLNSMITSIEVSQTYNPMFGTIDIPGIQPNIVAAYYGYTGTKVTFPFGDAEDFTLDSKEMIAYAPKNSKLVESVVVNGLYNEEADNNLGHIYTTINPSNINFNNQPLKLVRSNGVEAPVTLVAKKSNEELRWGYTRDGEVENGFYRVEANVTPEQAEALKGEIDIEPGLKSAFKAALKDHTKTDIARLGKVLLDQMSGIMPKYGLKAEWTVTDENGVEQTYAHYSKYDLAATALKPLSYGFLADGNPIDRRFPTFGPLTEVLDKFFNDLKGDIKIDLGLKEIEGIDLGTITIDLSEVKLDFDDPEDIKIKIDPSEIKIPNPLYGKTGYENEPEFLEPKEAIEIELTYNNGVVGENGVGALAGIINPIKEAVDKMFSNDGELANQLNTQINEQISEKLQSQVSAMVDDINEMLGGMQGRLDKQIADIIDKIHNQLNGKLGAAQKFVDLYNDVATRLNKFLDDPNYYIQVAMFYKDGNGSLHRLSNAAAQPSTFVAAGGNALEVYATSLTGEIVVPSYKKYVAICDMSGNVLQEQIVPGRQQEVAFNAPAAGKYRVLYSSLDYCGKTSTGVYYILVK